MFVLSVNMKNKDKNKKKKGDKNETIDSKIICKISSETAEINQSADDTKLSSSSAMDQANQVNSLINKHSISSTLQTTGKNCESLPDPSKLAIPKTKNLIKLSENTFPIDANNPLNVQILFHAASSLTNLNQIKQMSSTSRSRKVCANYFCTFLFIYSIGIYSSGKKCLFFCFMYKYMHRRKYFAS